MWWFLFLSLFENNSSLDERYITRKVWKVLQERLMIKLFAIYWLWCKWGNQMPWIIFHHAFCHFSLQMPLNSTLSGAHNNDGHRGDDCNGGIHFLRNCAASVWNRVEKKSKSSTNLEILLKWYKDQIISRVIM